MFCTAQTYRKLFKALDTSGDGSISREELYAMLDPEKHLQQQQKNARRNRLRKEKAAREKREAEKKAAEKAAKFAPREPPAAVACVRSDLLAWLRGERVAADRKGGWGNVISQQKR